MGVYCPYCATELFDPEADRCTSCGMFVTPELRAAIAAQVPVAARVSPNMVSQELPVAATEGGNIPIAMVVQDPAEELGRRWHEPSFTETQQSQVVWQTILFQTSMGLAIWGWAIVPLGRLGQMPYAWIPAVLAVVAGILGYSAKTRWWSLGIMLSGLVSVVVAAMYS